MKFSIDKLFDIKTLLRELGTGLTKLTFEENFQSFESEQTIAANTEVAIRNQLDSVPTEMLITKQTGNALITAGDTAWTSNYVYVKNHDASNSATVKVRFFK